MAAFGTSFAFLCGVFAVNLNWSVMDVCFAGIVCGGVFVLIFRKHGRWVRCTLFFLALVSGALYYHLFFARKAAMTHLEYGKKMNMAVIITDEPQPSEKFIVLTGTARPPFAGEVRLFAPLGSTFSYGDMLRLEGVVQKPTATGDDAVVFSPRLTLLARHKAWWIREKLIDLKLKILKKFREALPEDQAALLGGIAFGSKVSFKKELKKAMALSGTTHLVAVSGYNITIVILAAGGVFGRFFSRRTTFFLASLLLGLFILMVGFSASAVRAAIMGFLALVARESGRMFSMRNAVTLTAVIMTFLDPTALTKDMSFVLSYLSLLGIVYVGPPLKRVFRQSDPGVLDWKENAVTTLSAQIAVMPVLIRIFGQFSLTALLANILVLGTVPLTMSFGGLLAALGFISSYFAYFTARLAGLMLGYQLSVIRLFARFAVPLPVAFNSEFAIAFYYLIVITFVYSYGRKNKTT